MKRRDKFESIVAGQAKVRAQHQLTDAQRRVIEFYRSWHLRTGFWPSFSEARDGLGFLSNEAVGGHVRRLIAKGYMARGPRFQARTIMVLPDPESPCCPTCGRAFQSK